RIFGPGLAAPVSRRAAVDTLTFLSGLVVSDVRQNEEFTFIGCEQAIGLSVIQEKLVRPTRLHVRAVITASFDQDDFDFCFLKLPRRNDAGGAGSNDAYLSRKHGSVGDVFSVFLAHGFPPLMFSGERSLYILQNNMGNESYQVGPEGRV